MKPLATMVAATRSSISVILTDIDDTLTTDGRLTAEAYASLEKLQASGLRVVPVTGRPAGWCDHIARVWPVDGVVGENGAFYFRYHQDSRRMARYYLTSTEERAVARQHLDRIRDRILAEVPGCAVSADQAYREADLAIDFREDVPPLPAAAIRRIVAIFEAEGASAKVSSIHVNGWFGRYDKLTMVKRLLKDELDIDTERERECVLFVGDSPNDAPLFDYFPNTVGVANIRDYIDTITATPAYVTESHSGAGFAEVARFLIGEEEK